MFTYVACRPEGGLARNESPSIERRVSEEGLFRTAMLRIIHTTGKRQALDTVPRGKLIRGILCSTVLLVLVQYIL